MPDRLFADATLAALYDRLNARRRRADFDFYLPMVMAANAVLDVGCGTGAMLKEARTAGHAGRLCGLDPAAGMIAEAQRASDIEWIEGNLASVAWDGAFDLIVMTGHTFQVFVEDDELRTALAAVRKALAPDGRFAFETRNPSAREWERWTPNQAREIIDAAGRKVRVTRHVARPFDGRTLSFTHTFTSPDWPRPETSHSTLRFLDAPFARRLPRRRRPRDRSRVRRLGPKPPDRREPRNHHCRVSNVKERISPHPRRSWSKF